MQIEKSLINDRLRVLKVQSTLSNSNPYNSNEIPWSPQNFLTNSHGKTCIIRTSTIRTFTNPNTFAGPLSEVH